jgi:hypothetical protein
MSINTIVCRVHGEFRQKASAHLQGKGCELCAVNHHKNTTEFIHQASKVHGGKYTYEKVKYIECRTLITISCPQHGDFTQKPYLHLQGMTGCKGCAMVGYSKVCCRWLDSVAQKRNIFIHHALNGGEKKYNSLKFDGFCEETNTVFEFHGCFWHGCPECFPDREYVNPVNKFTMDVLYDKTLEREQKIRDAGFTLEVMWECQHN